MGISKLFLAALVSLGCFAAQAANVTLQAGAFTKEEDARKKASEIEAKGFKPVNVRSEESPTKGLFFKVLVGDFDNRASAATMRSELKTAGYDSYIRAAESFDKVIVEAAVTGSRYEPYFQESATSATDKFTSYSAALEEERRQILGRESTSSETLANYLEFINRLENSAARSRDIIALGHYSYAGKSAYANKVYNLSQSRSLLLQVANGQLISTQADCLTAREMVAHELHYYTRNYIAALNAYRQLLQFYEATRNLPKAAKIRMEIAATSFELTKTAGFSKETLEQSVAELWTRGTEAQAEIQESETPEARQVRIYTSRIGLMFEEIVMLQNDWNRASEINNSVIGLYEERPECSGELAEAYCHKAAIEIKLKSPAKAKESADKAIELMKNRGRKQWGDVTQDPYWKAYILKNNALLRMRAPATEREELIRRVKETFPGHPNLQEFSQEGTK